MDWTEKVFKLVKNANIISRNLKNWQIGLNKNNYNG